MTDAQSAVAHGPLTNRSRVTNGTVALEGIDHRTRPGRRYRDLVDDYAAEFGCATASEVAKAHAAAVLTLDVETLAAQRVRGEPTDSALLSRQVGRQRRALADLEAVRRAHKRAGR